jgi:glycosyltransferase involved in cell wall biosynthesis
MNSKDRMISFVIPVKEEEATVAPLYENIEQAMSRNKLPHFEVIFIDDGSNDGSWRRISELSHKYPQRVKSIRFRRNFGKAAALAAGFHFAVGEIIFTMDSDLQDDPNEIPRFLEKLDEGYDLVSGWKQRRNDPISKTLPSRFFNFVTRSVSGVKLHDFNCGYKAYRSEVLRSIKIYGELHRFIPILAYNQGFKIGEIAVEHHSRQHGRSKYGWERYTRGFLDLLTVMATTKYLKKPGHLFGGVGILSGLIGFMILFYLFILTLMGVRVGDKPILFLGVMMSIMAVQFISLGLIAELINHNLKAQPVANQIVEMTNLKSDLKSQNE